MPTILNQNQLDKLGNTLIYFSKHVGDFNKTKALKLLFLVEEKSIQRFGVPFFGFEFNVWQFGPVFQPAYEALNNADVKLLSAFIKRAESNPLEFEASAPFNDDEFSKNDLQIIDEIIAFARHKTASDLVQITHADGSLWKNAAIKNNLLKGFEEKTITMSDVLIDFSTLLDNESYLYERYKNSKDFIQFSNTLKA